MNNVIIALSIFAALVALLVMLRARTQNKIDIKSADIAMALVPVALWLFLTGKIQELGFGDIKIVAAIKDASKAPVGPQVSQLTVDTVSEPVRVVSKGGPEVVPQMINTKSQALAFTIGHGGYVGMAIADYLEQLTKHPFLRYLVINNPDGSFFGIADARQVADIIRGTNQPFNAQDLAQWLNGANRTQLETLPGFIPADKALHRNDAKRKALEKMNSLDAQVLPVLDDGRFSGIVDRSKLTASMLTEIAERMEKSN